MTATQALPREKPEGNADAPTRSGKRWATRLAYEVAEQGDNGPPCGVPSTLGPTSPFSITPVFKNARMSFRSRGSSTRCAMRPISLSWLTRYQFHREVQLPLDVPLHDNPSRQAVTGGRLVDGWLTGLGNRTDASVRSMRALVDRHEASSPPRPARARFVLSAIGSKVDTFRPGWCATACQSVKRRPRSRPGVARPRRRRDHLAQRHEDRVITQIAYA